MNTPEIQNEVKQTCLTNQSNRSFISLYRKMHPYVHFFEAKENETAMQPLQERNPQVAIYIHRKFPLQQMIPLSGCLMPFRRAKLTTPL